LSLYNCILKIESQEITLKQYIYEVGGYRYNWHNDIEVMIVMSGNVEVCVEGEVYDYNEGDIIIINSNEGHSSLKKSEASAVMVLHLNPEYIKKFDNLSNFRFSCASNEKNRNTFEFKRLRELLANLMLALVEGDNLAAIGYYNLIISHLMKYFFEECTKIKVSKNNKQQKLFKTIIKFIENNYHKKISLNDIANLINYNTTYTSIFFKSHMGINFHDYLLRVRLQSAVFELLTTQKTINNIALDNGFSDVKAFNAKFKQNFKKSPSEYRNKNKDLNPIQSIDKRNFVSVNNELIMQNLLKYSDRIELEESILSNSEELPNKHTIQINHSKLQLVGDDKTKMLLFLDYLQQNDIELRLDIK